MKRASDEQTKVGPYLIDRKLGSGGMAQVWHGVHVEHGVDVAVKVLHRAFASDADDRQFRGEVVAVAMLDHPGIIRILDFGAVPPDVDPELPFPQGAPYLVVEFADALNLQERMHGPEFGWEETREVLLQILEALGHAHARGVVHRDLKPDNILGFHDGSWKLADFGIATLLAASDGTEHNPSGTPLYMSPEQFRGRLADTGPWTDLYSLGCMAYQLITGEPPFVAQSALFLARMHIEVPPEPMVPRFAVPDGVEAWVLRLLQKAPLSRYQRAADAAAALQRLGGPVDDGRVRPRRGSRPLQRVISDPTVRTPGLEDTLILDQFGSALTTRFEAAKPQERPPMPADWRPPQRPVRSLLDGRSTRLFGLRATPVVGRVQERDQLWKILGDVERGSSRTAILRGNSGAGKSRLAQWLCVRAHELGIASTVQVVSGRDETTTSSPPSATARHLMLLNLSSEELTVRLDELREQLGVDPRVSLLVLEAHRRLTEGSQELPRGWAEACARLLSASAKGRPVIVFVDDLQWAPLWLKFFGTAPDRLSGVLLLGTVQNEAVAERDETGTMLDAVYEASGARIFELPELVFSECQELVGDLLRLEPGLAHRIARRAGGNPMFATQLVGDWVARGWLVARSDGWHLLSGVEPELPDNLHDVWQARLAQLLDGQPADHRHALEIAAILGKNVNEAEWRAALAEATLSEPVGLVEALVVGGLATRLDEGWAFAHDMLRESVLRNAREAGRYARVNAVAAKALLQTPNLNGLAAGRVGRHLFRAGEFERALEPLYIGAQAAFRTGGAAAAAELLEMRAIAVERSGAPARELCRTELLRANSLHRLRKSSQAISTLQRVLAQILRLGELSLAADAYSSLARLSSSRGDQTDTLGYSEQALALYRQLEDTAGQADAHLRLGDYYSYAGELALSRANYVAAATAALASDNGFAKAWSSWGIGFLDYQLGELDSAKEHLERAMSEFEEIGDVYYVHVVVASLADVERVRGNFDEAQALYERCESFMVNTAPLPASAAVNRTLLELMRGRTEAARAQLAVACTRIEKEAAPNVLNAILALRACFAARDEDRPTWESIMASLPQQASQINVLEYDFVWSFEQAVREAAGRFPDDIVAECLNVAIEYWRTLGRTAEAEGLEELALRL